MIYDMLVGNIIAKYDHILTGDILSVRCVITLVWILGGVYERGILSLQWVSGQTGRAGIPWAVGCRKMRLSGS